MAAPSRRDACRSHWLALPARLYLSDRTPNRAPVQIELRTGDKPVTLHTTNGEVQGRPGPAESPDAVITGSPEQIMGLLMRCTTLGKARAAGLKYEGDPVVLRRVQRT